MPYALKAPDDIVIINDNTFVKVQPNVVTGPKLLCCFLADRGREDLLEHDDLAAFLNEHGSPVFKRHGQAILNAAQWLKGGGIVIGKRIVAPDAKLSNLGVIVKSTITSVQKVNGSNQPLYLTPQGAEVTEATGNTPIMIKKAKLVTEARQFVDVDNFEELKTSLNALNGTNESGAKVFPIMGIAAQGRGKYGDSISFRLSTNEMENKRQSGFFNYNAEIIDRFANDVEGPFTATLSDEAVKPSGSLFISEVVKNNSKKVDLYFSDAGYTALMAELAPVLAENNITAEMFNPFYLTGAPVQWLDFTDSTDISNATGFSLGKGSDGAWTGLYDMDNNMVMKSEFIKFYSGISEPKVLNYAKCQASCVIDANFPLEVKVSLAQFKAERDDIFVVLDAGENDDVTALANMRGTISYDTPEVFIYGGSGDVYDIYSKRSTHVTITYALAERLPLVIDKYPNTPMAGLANGVIDTFLKGTFGPVPDTTLQTDLLYEAQINYCETDERDRLYLATCLTSQKMLSERSYVGNIIIEKRIVRKLRNLVRAWRYQFTSPSDIARFTEQAAVVLGFEKGLVKSLDVSVSQTAQQKELKTVQVTVNLIHQGFIERTLIIINVNKE